MNLEQPGSCDSTTSALNFLNIFCAIVAIWFFVLDFTATNLTAHICAQKEDSLYENGWYSLDCSVWWQSTASIGIGGELGDLVEIGDNFVVPTEFDNDEGVDFHILQC